MCEKVPFHKPSHIIQCSSGAIVVRAFLNYFKDILTCNCLHVNKNPHSLYHNIIYVGVEQFVKVDLTP